MFYRKFLVIIPALLWCPALFAQFTLDGKISDKTNSPNIPGDQRNGGGVMIEDNDSTVTDSGNNT